MVESALVLALFGISAVLLVAVVYRFPSVALVLVFAMGVVPDALLPTGLDVSAYTTVWLGLTAVDAVLFAMCAAVVIRILAARTVVHRRGPAPSPVALAVCAAALSVWLLLEVARNWADLGVSSLGEFRFRYLPLILPAYLAVSLVSVSQRRKALKLGIGLSVFGVLALVPAIGLLRGWTFGPSSRFLPAALSLVLLYGTAALVLAARRGVITVSRSVVAVVATIALALVLIDSNRSVWLAGIVGLAMLCIVGELRLERAWRWGSALGFALAALLLGAVTAGGRPVSFIVERASAIYSPLNDPNATWRFLLWKSELGAFSAHPIAGEGFGGYWSAYVPELGRVITVQPHDFYVQTLVKLGIVGLVLWLACVALVALHLGFGMRRLVSPDTHLDRFLAMFGLVTLIATCAYLVAYALDPIIGMWVGIGLASALQARRRTEPSLIATGGIKAQRTRPERHAPSSVGAS